MKIREMVEYWSKLSVPTHCLQEATELAKLIDGAGHWGKVCS